MTDVLHIARGLDLPLDAVTQPIGIIARRGRGKTYTAKVIAEEMLKAGQQIAVLDPLGAWSGLRSSADGKHAGLSILILGGKAGDLPLEPTAGALIADFIVDTGRSVIIDLSQLESLGAQDRFARDFAMQLYQRKKTAAAPTPLHLFVDEADSFAPQKPQRGQEQMLGAFESLVRRGRMAGIGVTLITQRPAVLNKNVLTQIELLIVLQITGPQDRDAIKPWIEGNADPTEAKLVLGSLATLEVGEAWFWSPSWLGILKRVKVRKAETFDSSATPKAGQVRAAPQVLAPVDLDRLSAAMAETVERAAENDPKTLRARIKVLEKQLAGRAPETVEVPVEVLVPIISGETLDELQRLLEPHRGLLGEVEAVLGAYRAGMSAPGRTEIRPQSARKSPAPQTAPAPRPPRAVGNPSGNGPGEKMKPMQRAILTAHAQHPGGRTIGQLTTLTGYRNSGGFKNALSDLRTSGYMTGKNTEVMYATDEGIAALGTWEPLPTGDELIEHWIGNVSGMERVILRTMIDRADEPDWDADGLAAVCINPANNQPYANSGGFKNALSKLRTLELIEGSNTGGMHLHPDFAEAIDA